MLPLSRKSEIVDEILKSADFVSPQVKQEFQRYAEEIFVKLQKDFPDIAKEKPSKINYMISGVIMAFSPSDANHNNRKKYFPDKYNEELVTNGDKNTYDSEWYKMHDAQQDTIIRKALKKFNIS